MIVLGSSLTVTPACDMPREAAERGAKLVICNLQKTPLDSLCCLRVFAKTDELMKCVLDRMNLNIPEWRLHRRVKIEFSVDCAQNTVTVHLAGLDQEGTPASFLKSVQSSINGVESNLVKEPFSSAAKCTSVDNVSLEAKLHFMGHFNEPPNVLKKVLQIRAPNQTFNCDMILDLNTGQWNNEWH